MSDIEGGPRHSDNNVNLKFGAQYCYDEKKNQLELYKAALSNDWKKAEITYSNARMKYGVKITARGETALHIAALAGHSDFVQNLVHKMTPEEIRIETTLPRSCASTANGRGNTAFHCAAISGNVKIAKAIMKSEDLHDLAMARGVGNHLPINMAAAKGNAEMVRFLFEFAYKNHLHARSSRYGDDEDRKTLFLRLIKADIYDIALQMAKTLLCRQIAPEEMEEEALQELAQKPLNPPGFLHRCIHSFSPRQVVLMHENAVELVGVLWDKLTETEKRVSAVINSTDPNPIIEAAKRGNYKFLSTLIASYPDVLFTCDDNNKYTIIHHAILNRHVDIFKFIHLGSGKNIVTMYRDIQGNNMLHLAAKLAPPNRLNIVPGAALQLQRELLWFEEVKKVMEPHEVNRKKYYLNDFPLERMLLLVEEMKKLMNQAICEEGLLTKLWKVMERENNESIEHHPSYKGLWKSENSPYILIHDHRSKEDMKKVMNESDVYLLFKKLKKVVEQEQDGLEYYTQLWEILDLLQELSKEIDEYGLNQNDTKLVLKKVKEAMGQHPMLGSCISHQRLLDLFQEIDRVMKLYEPNRCNPERLYQEVNGVMWQYERQLRFPSKLENTRIGRVASFFENINTIKMRHNQYGQSDIGIFFETLKNLMENYKDLKEYPPRTTESLLTMSRIFEEIYEALDRYERHPDEAEITFEKIKSSLTCRDWRMYIKHKRILDLFQEMKEVIEQHEHNQNDKVTEEYTPHDVFVKEHKELMAEGEKWMRDTANSCMIVAVLITTIAFAAAITIPGGNGDNGYPHFLNETLFKIFAIADSVSMICSATALLDFLSILTARYNMDDFR